MLEEKHKDLQLAIQYTYQASESRPYSMLIRSLSKFSKDEIKEIALYYYMAGSLISLFENKKMLKFDFPLKFSIKSATRFFVQIIDMNNQLNKDEEFYSRNELYLNIPYFKRLKVVMGNYG